MSFPADLEPVFTFLHPVLMWVLLGLCFYALYLGLQSRRVRSAQGAAKKELIKGKFTQRHYQIGSLLLFLMILGTVSGMGVTYVNNQKLFVGPHLLAGLGMTSLVGASAALSPFMQKGQDWARYTHIVINVVILGLFGWQAVTGMQIVQRILDQAAA